ncbi:amino acid ABC transporter permease [Smaragdicoccus niigatensis]|uniref:amino acid ABC transporter permease n=1 Tax=Smaragdicoccus niigatensis TaxID=359359 RepID=UPI00035EBA07|nr:amino acid ABC transporter permease [Smaragdicoccus niigatensis]
MTAKPNVLYDAPGPRARARYTVLNVVVLAGLAWLAYFVYTSLKAKGQLTAAKWSPFLESTTWTTYILPGIEGTLTAAVLSISMALVLGAVLGISRLSDHRSVRWIAGGITELFRAVPVLILLIFIYHVYSQYHVVQSKYYALAAVVTGLTLYNGAVIAEIVRAGIKSLPRGQTEAAQALGLRKNAVMRLILLPQAVTAMLPAILSQMVVALKDSALGYLIGLAEVVRAGTQIGSFYRNYLPSLIVVAIIMILMNSALTAFATHLEKRLRSRKRSSKRPPRAWQATSEGISV